tara:strand:- start:15 stop:680 length:666 start_codon:yes stop_codon:yes gene_type:complete
VINLALTKLCQKSFWEDISNRRSPSHPAVKAFVVPKIKKIMEIISHKEYPELLEVGCGNGFFSNYLKNYWNVISLDRSKNMLSLNSYPKKIRGDVKRIPMSGNSFDIVFSANLLHHIESPDVAVKEMKRVSKRYVVLIEPNRNNPLMFLFNMFMPIERMGLKFSLNYLESLATNAGLNLLYSCSQGSIVPNKTPLSLIPVLSLINREIPLGFYIMVIAEKN